MASRNEDEPPRALYLETYKSKRLEDEDDVDVAFLEST